METLCNVILQGFKRHRRILMAHLFLALEATSFVIDQIGGNQFGFRFASFVLSLIGFLMICCETDLESERIMIESVFSVVQLIITSAYLVLPIFGVNFKSNIASIFPLVLAGTTLILAYRRNEIVQERDEEEGFAGPQVYQVQDVTTSDNLSRVNREEVTPDTRAFISPVNTSTVVEHEIPDSRVLHAEITQSSIMVNKEDTATMSKQEEISEKSRASLVSSNTPMMSKDEKIAILTAKRSDVNEETADPTAALTTPAVSSKTPAISSMTKLFSKLITTTDLEKELILPIEAMEHFPIPEGQDSVDLLVNDIEGEIHKFQLTIKSKPVLTKGWLEFVKSKAVIPEDTVTFYKQQHEDSEEQYRVEIDRINN